jgi:hypothetical protein
MSYEKFKAYQPEYFTDAFCRELYSEYLAMLRRWKNLGDGRNDGS